MANKKITDLTELTAAASDDYLEIVDTSANTSKKISRENLIGSSGDWQSWTPTFTAGTGTFADTTGSYGRYCTIGKVMHISIYFNIVDKGTASGVWYFSLPSGFTCSVPSAGCGREILLTGNSQTLTITSGQTSVEVRKYDNASSIGTGCGFLCGITLGV